MSCMAPNSAALPVRPQLPAVRLKLGRAEVQGHTAAPDPRPRRISSDLAWNPAGARMSSSLKLPVASSAVHQLETAACRSSPWNPCWIWPPPPRVPVSDDEDTTLPGSGASCRFWRPRRPPSRSSTGEKEAERAAARLGSGQIRVVGQLRLARTRGAAMEGCWYEAEAGFRQPRQPPPRSSGWEEAEGAAACLGSEQICLRGRRIRAGGSRIRAGGRRICRLLWRSADRRPPRSSVRTPAAAELRHTPASALAPEASAPTGSTSPAHRRGPHGDGSGAAVRLVGVGVGWGEVVGIEWP
jgi:hypothetical protein